MKEQLTCFDIKKLLNLSWSDNLAMAAHLILYLLLGLCSVVSGQSFIGASMPCEEANRDPDVNNPMDNLICPFTNETCITATQICDCVNVSTLSGSVSGSGSGSELFSGEYEEVLGINSLDCSKSLKSRMGQRSKRISVVY